MGFTQLRKFCKLHQNISFIFRRRLLWAYVCLPSLERGQLHLEQGTLYAGQAGSLDDFFIWHVVLPVYAQDGAQAALVKSPQHPELLPMEDPGLHTIQKSKDDGSVYLCLCGDAEWMMLPYSLWQSSQEAASLGLALVKIFVDCHITGDDATQVSVQLHSGWWHWCWSEAAVVFSWRGWYNICLLQADGKAKVLGCIKELVQNVNRASCMWTWRVKLSAKSSFETVL